MSAKSWENRVIANILDKSQSKDFETALGEWFFNGKIFDRKKAAFSCELCGHNHVRYHYIITNKATSQELMVGSSCILKYNTITIYDNNNSPIKTERLRKIALEDALDLAKLEQLKEPLRQLWRLASQELKETIANQVNKYLIDGHTTPKVCLMWFSMMKKLDIQYDEKLFKINLRKSRYLDQIIDFKEYQFKLIAPALSTQQLQKVNEIRQQFNQTPTNNTTDNSISL
ncbi:hypothetical protein [Photobacterium damselae]|uniref:hypothetical protein n=1 Tax=Photobacterium damselae TaxID=38293 RepID=UPI001F43B91A|nr:hypothetical protein [Photobacterium damselae]UKA04902.1 hypothetical protein IHC89_21905 [Photobacterium damselae subsp. damselae]